MRGCGAVGVGGPAGEATTSSMQSTASAFVKAKAVLTSGVPPFSATVVVCSLICVLLSASVDYVCSL